MNERDLELLSAYLDDVLTAEERSALDARLLTDAALRRELDTLRETKLLISGLPQLKAPRDFRLTPAIVGGRARALPVLLSPWVSALSAAAAVIMTVLGFITANLRPLPLTSIAEVPTAIVTLPQAAAPAMLPTGETEDAFVAATPTAMGTMELPFAGDAPPVTFTPSPQAAAEVFGAAEALGTATMPATVPLPMGGAGAAVPPAPMATMAMATAAMESAPAESAADASVAMMPAPTGTDDAARTGNAMDAAEASTPTQAMTAQAEAMQMAAPTATLAPVATLQPTARLLPTLQPTATPTSMDATNADGMDAMNGVRTSVPGSAVTASPTPMPVPEAAPSEGFGGAALYVLGGLLFIFALVTTLLRGRLR